DSVARHPPGPSVFPYTTLFRSAVAGARVSRCYRSRARGLERSVLSARGGGRRQALARKLAETLDDGGNPLAGPEPRLRGDFRRQDRKSTRLNSSHGSISYAVFC